MPHNTLSGHQSAAADILDGPDPSRSGIDSDFQQSEHITHTLAPPITTLEEAYGAVQRLRDRLRLAVRGRDDEIELIIIALLADGHVLLEDYPGSGKTTLAKALGDCIIDDQPHDDIVTIRRIQFTPDLLPSDVTGTTIFDPNTNRFFFRPGPIFAHVVLADEINRTSPKVQSALLEAMAEKQTTVDNRTRKLDDLFFVLATQNPLDLAGRIPARRRSPSSSSTWRPACRSSARIFLSGASCSRAMAPASASTPRTRKRRRARSAGCMPTRKRRRGWARP
ncbi:MAG: AAA family ATPase, partial [Enhygromyxa sp.]